MSTSDRPYHHGDLRAALLDAADALLDAGGDGAVSLREAARMAGASPTAAYRHFADKEALLAALAARHFAEFGAALATSSLDEMGRAYVRFALARPGRFRLMFGPLLARAGRHPALAEAADAAFARLGGQVDSREAALRAWSMAHGLAHLLLDGAIASEDAEGLVARVLQRPRGTRP
ncbi:TetR-like C-terminal domain-containing protein [Paracraurococcus lichenis]|uniref:TetR/AcrR family transcriptional regulator n=1 Tax=Paracraurococcus lichenis TaxID=3064888 RepID=A0ABT9E1B9_9PROT|nr:TetR/AcrR family transcriptional regulator [Paracraurococcus sp. LOR1-02]MDO9709815.1 TetR/AcrR family transcriptional regulator [Paracraurococcus sp. LOR1-02]